MHYACAYERRAQVVQQLALGRGGRMTARPPPATMAAGRPNPAAPANPAPTAMRPFRRLTPAEQVERQRLGLCFNCDETYGPSHVCPRLFYLEMVDDTEADTPPEASDRLPPQRRPSPHPPSLLPRRSWSLSTRWLAYAMSARCSCR
jgi:hypothetical protein